MSKSHHFAIILFSSCLFFCFFFLCQSGKKVSLSSLSSALGRQSIVIEDCLKTVKALSAGSSATGMQLCQCVYVPSVLPTGQKWKIILLSASVCIDGAMAPN